MAQVRQLPSAARFAPGHLQGILERLRTRSGVTAERLRTTDLEVGSLLDLPEVQRIQQELGLSSVEAVVEAVRRATSRVALDHLVVADAALALRLLSQDSVSETVWKQVYAEDLGDRRNALVEHWEVLFGARGVTDPPPRPTVRQLRAALESAALGDVAAGLAQASAPELEPDRPGVRALVNDLLSCSERVEALSKEHPDCEKLLTGQFSTLCREMGLALKDLSAGEITVNPDGEIMFAIDCLELASRTLKAVSYEEDEFWTQPQGERYFEAQKALIAKTPGFELKRLFVVKSDPAPEMQTAYRTVIDEQMNAGISVGVIQLPAPEWLANQLEDFIVYDDRYVRYAHADRTDDDRGLTKTATLSMSLPLAQRYLERFRTFETTAIDGERYLAETDSGTER